MFKALNVAGARPNFMKLAPVHKAMIDSGRFQPFFLHTGQHYDGNMSQTFLDDLQIRRPDFELSVGSGSHAQQTAAVIERIEPVLVELKPDVVIVFGDVNSTIAAAITAVKLGVKVAHVEAGLRSFDRSMPEEINRVLTDSISDILFPPSQDGVDNLLREGVPADKIFLVGNVMIDTLLGLMERAKMSTIRDSLELREKQYMVATLHRPSNVDNAASLERSIATLSLASKLAQVVLVAHPRTSVRIEEHGLSHMLADAGVRVIEPLGYIDFLSLVSGSAAVLTDSGGIQEETTVLGIPCITLRTTTERPITITQGTNHLVGTDPGVAIATLEEALRGGVVRRRPPLWDGHAAGRIVDCLIRTFRE
ncbi:MAG: non-hydrolyzing UDP-N-acetylglucosamine 2-epimerase [Actinomycetota bacterium]|nr:UDP-N-acetylglucosamine 2-epimerase (non-hydrolyzing) [Actinomycetota bacterium]